MRAVADLNKITPKGQNEGYLEEWAVSTDKKILKGNTCIIYLKLREIGEKMNVVLKICATFLVVLMVLPRMHHALPKTASQIQDLKTLECKKDLDCPVGRPCCTAIKVDFKTHHVCLPCSMADCGSCSS